MLSHQPTHQPTFGDFAKENWSQGDHSTLYMRPYPALSPATKRYILCKKASHTQEGEIILGENGVFGYFFVAWDPFQPPHLVVLSYAV